MQTNTFKDLENRFDIWRYASFMSPVPEQFWISDQRQNFTRLEKRNEHLFIKHEDEHPLGSHKGRSLAFQLSRLSAEGKKLFTLSSSGNAAYAFLRLISNLDPSASSGQGYAFVSPKADAHKLAALLNLKTAGEVVVSDSPRIFANWLVNKHHYVDLRPSQSDDAITGLMSLGFELFEQVPDLSDEYSIFSVTTSGGNILGVYQAFKKLQEKGLLKSLPSLYPVLLQDYKGGTLTSERKNQLESAVQETQGEIFSLKPVWDGKEKTSFEGNTAMKAYEEFRIGNSELGEKKAIVIFTGKVWEEMAIPKHKVYSKVTDFAKDFVL